MTVTMEDLEPGIAEINSTVRLQDFVGNNCRGQFVAPAPNPNTCGVVTGTENATGLAKVIGGPVWAELLSVNVTDLECPTFTLPKLLDSGVIFKFSGTAVAVGVGVAVLRGVRVAVGVLVGLAVSVAVGVGAPLDV